MNPPLRQRIDLWLHRARFAKTRTAAARLVSEGGVRLVVGDASRRLDKPATEIQPGDVLAFMRCGRLISIRIVSLGQRRGPAAEARSLYCEFDADGLA